MELFLCASELATCDREESIYDVSQACCLLGGRLRERADAGYMGDYMANVSDGSRKYFAWGDNRDKVTNFLWRKPPDDCRESDRSLLGRSAPEGGRTCVILSL